LRQRLQADIAIELIVHRYDVKAWNRRRETTSNKAIVLKLPEVAW